MRMKKNPSDRIIEVLATKSSTKQQVHRNVLSTFARLKGVLIQLAAELNAAVCDIDRHVVVEFFDRGEFEAEIRFSGDALVFQVHTNAFALPPDHPLRKLPEAKSDPLFAYFGMIHVYNFLADSFRMNRLNDAGYLLGRILVNKDGRAMLEGHDKLTRALSKGAVDEALLKEWVQQAILYAMAFDLMASPFEGLEEVSVAQFLDVSGQLKQRTTKTLGFRPS
jgi:hypothetical protein